MLSLSRICHKNVFINPIITKSNNHLSSSKSMNVHRFINSRTTSQNVHNFSKKSSISIFLAVLITSIFISNMSMEAKEPMPSDINPYFNSGIKKEIDKLKKFPDWKLADRISGSSKLPAECIDTLLEGAFNEIEEYAQIKISKDAREKISNSISNDHVEYLKDILLLNVSDKIFGKFTDKELEEMLEEHEEFNIIQNEKYLGKLQAQIDENYDLIVDIVYKEAHELAPSVALQVKEAWQKDNILPNKKI